MALRRLLKLSNYLKLYKRDFIVVMIALLCVAFSLLILGKAFKSLIDEGVGEQQFIALNQSILLIDLLIVIFGVSSFFRAYTINNIAEKIIGRIRLDAFTNLINHDITYFEDEKVGTIISKLTGDLELVSKLIVNFLSFFIRNSIMLIGAIIGMFFQSYKLSLIVIITIPLILIPILKLSKYVRSLSKEALNSQSEVISNLIESFTYIRTIFAFNQQENRITTFKKLLDDNLSQTSKRLKIRSLFFALTISFILISITFVIWVGSTDILKKQMTSGEMISFIYYAIVAGLSAGGIAELLSEIHSPLAALERVFEFINFKNNDSPSSTHSTQTAGINNALFKKESAASPTIEFRDVSFSYPTRMNLKAVENISFKILPNSFVGVIGPSGSGKSTIMQLLLKFYSPSSGNIILYNQDISQEDPKIIRNLVAYVAQDVNIFSGTIKTNIAFSNPLASEEDILRVVKITGIMDFVKDLNDGLDTKIGEKGVKLSGGQKQRIAIARALLYNPEILLLDEATSSIDFEGEQILLSEIKEIMHGKIVISIAHRISSLENADKILIINQGKIIVQGNHTDLLKESNFYTNLLEKK